MGLVVFIFILVACFLAGYLAGYLNASNTAIEAIELGDKAIERLQAENKDLKEEVEAKDQHKLSVLRVGYTPEDWASKMSNTANFIKQACVASNWYRELMQDLQEAGVDTTMGDVHVTEENKELVNTILNKHIKSSNDESSI